MLQFILLGSGAGQRRKNGKRSPAPTFPILQIGWLLQLDSLHIHWASLRLKLVVLSCAVCGCSFGKPSEAHARNGDFSGCRGSAKGLGLNCRGFPPKARRRSADRRQATFKFIYASGGRGRGGGTSTSDCLGALGWSGPLFPIVEGWSGGGAACVARCRLEWLVLSQACFCVCEAFAAQAVAPRFKEFSKAWLADRKRSGPVGRQVTHPLLHC
jgi:hypothetical protein